MIKLAVKLRAALNPFTDFLAALWKLEQISLKSNLKPVFTAAFER